MSIVQLLRRKARSLLKQKDVYSILLCEEKVTSKISFYSKVYIHTCMYTYTYTHILEDISHHITGVIFNKSCTRREKKILLLGGIYLKKLECH